MKICVSADWHIDQNNRIDDFISTANNMLEEIRKICPDVFVFVGDAYKTWKPSPFEMNVFHNIILKISQEVNKVFIVVGNHDYPESEVHQGKHCFTELKTLISESNIQVIDEPCSFDMSDSDSHHLFMMIPHLPKSYLNGKSYDEVYKKLLPHLMAGYNTDWEKIVFSHAYIQEAKLGKNDMVISDNNRALSVHSLIDNGINYAFLGDIHKSQRLSERPGIYYTGSLSRVDFSEQEDIKGFIELDTEVGSVAFINVHARNMVEITLDLMKPGFIRVTEDEPAPINMADIESYVIKSLTEKKDNLLEAIVKIRFICNKQQKSKLDDMEEKIIKFLTDDCKIHSLKSISYELNDNVVVRNKEINEMLDPVQSLVKWSNTQNYSNDNWKKLILFEGEKIIKGM